MNSAYEYYESLGTHHPVTVSLTVAQAEAQERRGFPLPIGGDAETDHAKELLAIGRARRTTPGTGNIARDTGGFDAVTNELFDASFECFDCGLYYSWPVTPGLAPNADPKQTEMLALVKAHTPAVCRAAQAVAAVVREKEDAAEKASAYLDHENHVTALNHLGGWKIEELERFEANGSPYPVGGDCKVSLMDAIDRGAVTVTKGLPAAVVWRRNNPELAHTHNYFGWEATSHPVGLWPWPSHQALTDSFAALAGVQRRLMIGGVLQCRGDDVDARSAS